MITEHAYAKINLFLDILSKRENGYHNLLSYMQSVSLFDILTFSAEPSEELSIQLEIDGTNALSNGQDNLVYKSALKFMENTHLTAKISIKLEKKIPMQAGLGGGSSDAAATLRGLNKLFGFPLTKKELLSLAETLGADVPFCLVGGAQIVRGIGEQLSPLPMPQKLPIVLVQGKCGNDTKNAYSELDEKHQNFAKIRAEKVDTINAISEALVLKKDFDYQNYFYNIFEGTNNCISNRSEETKKMLLELGAKGALLTGSGSAVFGLFYNERNAEQAVQIMQEKGYQAWLCAPVGECEYFG